MYYYNFYFSTVFQLLWIWTNYSFCILFYISHMVWKYSISDAVVDIYIEGGTQNVKSRDLGFGSSSNILASSIPSTY